MSVASSVDVTLERERRCRGLEEEFVERERCWMGRTRERRAAILYDKESVKMVKKR